MGIGYFQVFGLFDFLVEQGIHATEERQGHLASTRVVVGHFVDPVAKARTNQAAVTLPLDL